jgi:hypothetical protein
MKAAILSIGSVLLIGAFMFFIGWDVLFSPPTLQEGTVTELFYIPPKAVTTYTPMNGRRIGNHPVITAKQEQWVAVVRNDNQDYQVHCTAEHYQELKVGDLIRYKKYEGEIFHIRYFAHYEDH